MDANLVNDFRPGPSVVYPCVTIEFHNGLFWADLWFSVSERVRGGDGATTPQRAVEHLAVNELEWRGKRVPRGRTGGFTRREVRP